MTTWLKHVEDWKDCQRCPLAKQRGRICLARGTIPCDVLFIGEAPGMNEDAEGKPFWGPAGQLLNQIIDRALPSDVACAFTNLVACFPREAKERGDNEPERDEILTCKPRLIEFANLAQPRMVVTVGGLADSYVSPICTGPRVHIVHPAYILSQIPVAAKGPATKKCIVQIAHAWEDAVKLNAQFNPWKKPDASSKTRREHLRDLYNEAAGADDIPY